VVAVGAVVGADVQVGAGLAHLLLQYDNILGFKAADQVHLIARLMQGPGHRQGDGAAQAAAQDGHTAHVLHLGGQAQRAYKILKAVALVQLVQRQGGAADLLIDYGNQAVRRTGDGEGNPLSLLVHPQNDELARLGLGGYQGRVHRDLTDLRGQHLFCRDFVLLHCFSSCQSSSFFHR
jgi:hypothetical protein